MTQSDSLFTMADLQEVPNVLSFAKRHGTSDSRNVWYFAQVSPWSKEIHHCLRLGGVIEEHHDSSMLLS